IEVKDFTQLYKLAQYICKSSFVPKDKHNKPEDCLLAWQMGQEIGLSPMASLNSISVINGRPTLWGDPMKGLIMKQPDCEDIKEYIEDEKSDNPVAVCEVLRKNFSPVTSRFSVQDAKRAGYWSKGGTWKTHPILMLSYKARGFALRSAFPDVLSGLITREEAEDYAEDYSKTETSKKAPIKNVTPVEEFEKSDFERLGEKAIDVLLNGEHEKHLEGLIAKEKIEKKAQQEKISGTDEEQLEPTKSAYDIMESHYQKATVNVEKEMA
ncbi:unnamed protein product, partial [marine sediment metagenome]